MPELLAAADVLVHSTGGVTCLEAMVGRDPGRLLRAARRARAPEHARDGRRWSSCGWPTTPTSCASRSRELRSTTRPTPPPAHEPTARARRRSRSAADLVLDAAGAVRPIPALAPAAGRGRQPAGAAARRWARWMMSTDEVTALAHRLLRVHPLAHVHTDAARRRRDRARARRRRRAGGRRAGGTRHPRLVRRRRGRAPARTDIARLRSLERRSRCRKCPARRRCAGCARAARCTPRRARWASATTSTTCSPAAGWPSASSVLARTMGATPVSGALRLSTPCGALPQRPMRGPATWWSSTSTARPPRCSGSSGSSPGSPRTGSVPSRWTQLTALAFHQRQQQRRAREHRRAGDQQRQRATQRNAVERRIG